MGRILFDVSEKRRGLAAFLFVGMLLLSMSLLISCGYKSEEADVEGTRKSQTVTEDSTENKDTAQSENGGGSPADSTLGEENDAGGTTDTGHLGMQRVLPEEVAVSPAIVEYTLDESLEIGEIVEFEGDLPGTGLGTLYTITIDGVEHFYGKYDFYGTEMKPYYGYAIFSEDYELANGIKVGISQAEVLEKYPYMRIEDFEGNCLSDSEYKEATWWNGTAYPTSALGTDPDFEYNGKDYNWLDQFEYVMIADIDLGTYDTLPICLGLLMKDEKVKAITFYYPTAG